MYQQSPQQNPALPQRPQQYQYPYQNQYQQQQQPYYNAPPQSMPGYNSPYQQQQALQQQNPQRPQTPSSVFSSSSDTSTSLLDISRFKDTKEYGGLLGTFFKAPSERVKQRLHRKKSKKRRVLYFGNSSSSSVNSDLAYGNGYTADEEIMALGQQLSNLARLSKEDEQRQARKASGKGKGKAAAMGLAAGVAGAAMASQYGRDKNGRMINGLKQRVASSDDEDEWEDASGDEDDSSSSSSSDGAGSAADSELAYGTVAESIKPALGAAAAAGSAAAAAAAGMADHRRQSSYGYDSSPEHRRHGSRGSVVDPRLFGPYNSLRGSINTPCGFRNDDEAVAYRRDSGNFGNGTPIHMRDTYSDPNRYDGERFSTPIAQQDPSDRPAPVPLQQPVPKTPVSSKVYDAVKVDESNRRNHRQRRSEQPEEKDWSGVAVGGIAAAAAAAGMAMAASSKKDSREYRDEQQRDRDDRENQRRLDRDRQRALELEQQKLRELERQKLRAQQRAQNPENEADRHEQLEKERARNMKWEREYREMEPEAIIPNYNNERKSSRYYDDDTPKDRNDNKEKSNVDVVVAPKSDQNEGRPFGIQYGPEFQLEREPTVQVGTGERKATRNGRDLPLATGAGHQAVTESTKSTNQDIDPFQYQVSDDAFTMSQGTTPGRPLTPNVVTIEREPNFDDSPPRDSAVDARLSRRDSFEIQRMVENYHRESQGASQRRDPRDGHEYEEEEHKARSILDEAKHATIPVAAAAVASAVAVENECSQERRKATHSEDSSRDTSRRRKDAVQEEADRYYRETNIARKIASDEMRSRSASPERSVVDKWQENKNESFTIVTPPAMEDKHPEKSIYEGPDADVKIDNKIHPREEHQYRNLGKKSSRRNVSRERPLLNLIYPTPAVSRQHTPAPEARKEPEAAEVVDKPEDFSIGPKGEIISVSEPVSAAKSVSWGENETKRFDADSPEKSDNDNYFPAEKAVEKSRPKLNKASRWGILAAALAGSSAEPQNEPDVEVDPKQTEMPGGYSYSDAGSSDVSIRRAEFYVDDMNSFPPVVGTKPASPQQMPGRFADDIEFAATLAAGLKDTGFNPDIVIDDPSYSRRDSPPGVQEATGDSHGGSNGNAWYKRPYAEAAPEPIDAPKLLPEQGFVVGEVETPQEATPLPYESERDIRADAPKPEDVPLPDNQTESPKPSKREQRKREKSDVVVVQDDGRIETAGGESSPSRDVGEAVWEDISRKKSKKDRKKDRKSRDFDDEWSSTVSAPAPYEPRSDYDRGTSQDENRDRDISISDVAKVAVPAALALGAIASSSRDTPSRDVRPDMSDSPEEPRKQLNDDYYYDGNRSRVSAPAEPRSDDEEERPKKSKRHPYGYDSPTQSMAASEISVASSSSKRSKKSKRRNGAGDDYDDSRDSPSHRKRESYDDRDASSAVSESRGHRRTSSRYDDDDAKSVASSSSRREKDYKERRTPEKRPSTSVLSGLFKPRKDKKDSFLGNADTLGAGVGLATAADIYASDARRSNAADAPSDRVPSASGDGLRHVRSFELVDPEVIPRVIKPAIDPQYGDLLPLPPSEPSSPTSSVSGELPPLPDSRPDTPPEERGVRREPWPQQRRRSIFETPMKSPSRTAVPIALRLGNRSNPASPVSFRASPASSPIIPHSDAVVMSRRQARPTSWDNSREFMPLYLLEQSRHPAPTTGSVLPALPPSEPSETSARNSPESEFLKHNDDYFGENPDYTGPDLRVDTVLSEQQKDSDAESQQTTPRAEFMPMLPEPTPSVASNEPTPGLAEPELPEPTPATVPDPPTPSLATPLESGSMDMAGDEHSAPPPFDAAAIAVPVGLGASAGLAAAALLHARNRADSPVEKTDDLTSADEYFSDAIEGPSEQTSPRGDISRRLSAAVDREPTSESAAKSPYEPSSETTTGAFTTPVNELVADEASDVTSHAELAAERTAVEQAEDQIARDIPDTTDTATEQFTVPINEHMVEERIHAEHDADSANEAAKEIEEPVVKEAGVTDKSAAESFAIPVEEFATKEPAHAGPDTDLVTKETVANEADRQASNDIFDVSETTEEIVPIPVSEPIVEEPAVEEPAVEEPTVKEPTIEEPTVKEPLVKEPTVEELVVSEPTVEEPLNAPSNTEHFVGEAKEDAIDSSTTLITEPTSEKPANAKYGAEPIFDEATAKEMEKKATTDAAAAFQAAETEAAAKSAAKAETAAQAEAEEVAKEEEEMAALKSKKAKKLTKAEKTRLMTLIANSVRRAKAKAAETTPKPVEPVEPVEPVTRPTAEPSAEEPVVEERTETQESTVEDSTALAKDTVSEALDNIQEPESTEQVMETTPAETMAEEPSRDLATEPIIKDVTVAAPESSPLPTDEPFAEPLADVVPETHGPSDELETEQADKNILDLPKSSHEPDTIPQPELVVEDVSVTEPMVENMNEKTEDLPREADNNSMTLTPDAIVEPQTTPSVDAPAEGTAEVVEVAEAKPEQPVAERAVNEITTEEWDKMNAKDRKNMKKKLKKQGLEPIIQDSFDLPAPADDSAKDNQPTPSEETIAEDKSSVSKSVTAKTETLAPSAPEPSDVAEAEGVQEPATAQGEEPINITLEEPSHSTEEDTLPVSKELAIQPGTESTVQEVEVHTEPAAPASENEPAPESATEAHTVMEPAPDATPYEDKAVEELPESPSNSKKKKKKSKAQQPPKEEPTSMEPTAVPAEDTAIDASPTPQAEKAAFDAWADPVVSIETPAAAPVDVPAEQSSAVVEDPLQPSADLPQNAPVEHPVDADAFDAWAQPDTVANTDVIEQEQDKPAEIAESLPEQPNESMQGEDSDGNLQDKSPDAPEKTTDDLTEPPALVADTKTDIIDDTPADEATPSKPVVSIPKQDGGKPVESVNKSHVDKPVLAAPVPNTREPDDLDDVPYSPSSGNQSPSTNDRKGYFPSALRALPGAAGISAFKRMWGFQDQARAQNRMRQAQPDAAKPSSASQPDPVSAETSEVAEAKPDVPIAEVVSDKTAVNKPLTSSDSHMSEPLFSQGDALVEESQATNSEVEPSQGDEPQNVATHVNDDVPDNNDAPTAVEQPVAEKEDGPAESAEITPETVRKIPTGVIESEGVKSVENPSMEIISDVIQAIEGKPDETAEDKPAEMTKDDNANPTELVPDDTIEVTEVKPELATEEEPNKPVEVENTKTAEETVAGNIEDDVSGSKKKAKKNKKKRKSQTGQDETLEHEPNDSVQQDQVIEETPVEEVTRVSNEADNQASFSEPLAEASHDIPEELSVTEPGAKPDNTTQVEIVDDQPKIKLEIEKSIEPEVLDQVPTDDKPLEGETKEEAKIDNEPTQVRSEEVLHMNEKPEGTPEARPDDNSEDKLQSGDKLPEAGVDQPQTDGKLEEPENQESHQTNHDAAQAEDIPTDPEVQLSPQVDDKPQAETEELQQMDGRPLESDVQETLQTDEKSVKDEIKEPDSDVKSPQAGTPKEDDKPIQPGVAERAQTDDKPTQADSIDDKTIGSEAKYPSSSEKQMDTTVSEEQTQASRDVVAIPSVDDVSPMPRKAGSPKAGSVAMKIKEAESKALRQAEDAETAKDNAEIEALLEKQSRRGGRLLKKDQKRLTALEDSVARRAEARAAREATPPAAQEPADSLAADANVQNPAEMDAKPAQPEKTRDIDIPQDTATVTEATAAAENQSGSEAQPTETSGEAETVGAGSLNEVTETLTDSPLEDKPTDDQVATDTAPAAEPQVETTVDNEVTEPASKKSKKKKKRKSVSFSENGESQDPTENTDTRTSAPKSEQLDQSTANTEDTPAHAERAPEEAPATQDIPEVPASEDTATDVPSSATKETEASSLTNPENPSAENTTAESQAEGPSDATLDKVESEPAFEKKSKKKKKKKKDTSTDEPEKQPDTESPTQTTSESISKVSEDAKDVEQEASSGTTNLAEPVEGETAEASPLPLGSETANMAPEILPTDDEQAQPADSEKPGEVSPSQELASATEATEVPDAVVSEQPPTEQPLPNVDEPDSPAKLSKKDKKKKKKADKKKAALEEESKEPEPEPTASSEKGEAEIKLETTERSVEDPKVTRDEMSKETDSKETPKADIILEGEDITPANEAKVPDTGNSGELPSEEPASPEDERGGFSLSQSQTDQKNKAKDSDFESVQDLKTNHPTQPETIMDPLESGLGLELGKEKMEDDEEFAGLSKKQIKKLKKARALVAPESSVEAEMPKESGISLDEAAAPATEAGTESESTPQTCAESAAETTTGAEQELGYETMNDPLPDIEETVPIIEPDFEAEPESKTEIQPLDNTDIQPATEGADAEPKLDADLQTRQPQSDGQTTSEQDIIVPAPDVDSGDNLTDVADKSSSTNPPVEHQVVKEPDSSRVEEAAEPPQILGESVETTQDSRSHIEAQAGPIASAKPEQPEVATEDIPSSSSNMAEKSAEVPTPVEAEPSESVEINQPLEETLADIPAESVDENTPEQAVQDPQEPILQPLEGPTQSSEPETVESEAISEPVAPVETTPERDTQTPSTDVATGSTEQTPLDLLPSSDLPLPTPVLPENPSSTRLVSETAGPESVGQDLSVTIEETDPLSVAPNVLESDDTLIPDAQTIPMPEEEGKSVESNVEKQLEELSQPTVGGSLVVPADLPLEEKPIEETATSSYPTTEAIPIPEPEEDPARDTEANQDITNETTNDEAKAELVELTKDKPTTPVLENQQQLVSDVHSLESSTSQSDPQVTDDKSSEKVQLPKEDAEKEGFEDSAPSETNVQETPEATRDTVLPQVESTTEDIIPDTTALPDSLPDPPTELMDTSNTNEPEKPARGENEFTAEDWQSLAAKEKKNIKKKLKRKGLDLIIQDSFKPTTPGSEVVLEAGTELEPVATQPEDLTTGLTEVEAQTEQNQEESPNKTSDKLSSSPNDNNVVDTQDDLNDVTKEQAEPTSQATPVETNISTESPSSQETPRPLKSKAEDKEMAELEGKPETQVPAIEVPAVEAPNESEMPSLLEESQRGSESQEEVPIPSPAKNDTSQETETEIAPVEPIRETEPELSTSHEPDHRVTTPQPTSEVPEAHDLELPSSNPVTETEGVPETHKDMVIGSGPEESSAPVDQTPLVQETLVVEESSDVSPKKSKKKRKSRKSDLSETETQAPSSSGTKNAVSDDVPQETRRSVEDTQDHGRNDKCQDQPDSIMTSQPANEMPSSVEQPSVNTDYPTLDTRETLEKSESQKENQEVSHIIDDNNAPMPTDLSPTSRDIEQAQPTQPQPEQTVTEKREPTSDITGEGRENTASLPDAHAEGRSVETERDVNVVPSEGKKKTKKAKKNSGAAGTELADSNNGHPSLEPVQRFDEQQDKPNPADIPMVGRSTQQTQDEPAKPDEENFPRNILEKPTSGLPTPTPKTTFEDIVKQKPGDEVAEPIKSPGRSSKGKTTTQPEGIASSIFSMASSFFSQKDKKKKRKGEPTGTPGSGTASPIEQTQETQHRTSQSPKSQARSSPSDALVEHIQPVEEKTTVNTPESPKQLDQTTRIVNETPGAVEDDSKVGQAVDTVTTKGSSGKLSKKDKKTKKKEQKRAEDEAKQTREAPNVAPSYLIAPDQLVQSNPDMNQPAQATESLESSTLPQKPEVSIQPSPDLPQSGQKSRMNEQYIEQPEHSSLIGSTTKGDAKPENEDVQASPAVKQPQSIIEEPLTDPVPSKMLESGRDAATDFDNSTQAKDLTMVTEPRLASPVDEPMTQPTVPFVPEGQSSGSSPVNTVNPQSPSAIPTKVEGIDASSDSKLSKKEKKKAKLALEKEVANEPKAPDAPDTESSRASKPIEPDARGIQRPSTPDNTRKLKETAAIEANDQDVEGEISPDAATSSRKGKEAERETGIENAITTPVNRKLSAPPVAEPSQPVTVPVQGKTTVEPDPATIVEPYEKAILPRPASDILTSGPDALTESPMTAAPVAIPQEPDMIIPEENLQTLPLSPQNKHMSAEDRSTKPALAPSPSFKNDTTLSARLGFNRPIASTKEKKKKRRKSSEQTMSSPEPVPVSSPGALTETDKRSAKTQKGVGDSTAAAGDKRPNKLETSIFARVTAAAAAAWGTKKAGDKTTKEQTQDEQKDGEGRLGERESTQDELGERASTDGKTTTEANPHDIKSPTIDTAKDAHQNTSVSREVQEVDMDRKTDETAMVGNESKDKERETTGNATDKTKTPEKRLKLSKGTESARQSPAEPKQPERQDELASPHGLTRDAPARFEQEDKKLQRSRPDDLDDVESPVLGRGDSQLSRGSSQKLLRRDSGVDEPQGGLLREDSTTIAPMPVMESDISDILRSPSRLLEPVLEVPEAETEPTRGTYSPPPQVRRNSGPAESFRDSGIETDGWEHPQPNLDRTVMQTPESKTERRLRRSPRGGTPVFREPTIPSPTPEPEKKKQYGILTPVGATVAAGAASYAGQRSFSDNASPVRRSTPRLESAARRAVSNTSLSRRRTPEPLHSRPESPGTNRSSGTPTPPLRRADKRMSGDLRSIRQQNNTATATATATAPVSSTPVANEGRARATKDMADIYDGFGEGRIGSPRSPTRPHSMRRRQSMQVLELENKVEQLMAENRMLTDARAMAETSLSQRAANSLAERDAEIDTLKQSLQFLQNEVSRLSEVNDGLASANTELANKDTGRVADLESRNAIVARELEEARRSKGTTEQSLEEKDAEIADLRAQLDSAKEKIRELQRQILEAKAHDAHFLNIRDEDHFDHRCQQLCSHVQQWVLRFSKFSDMRACRLTNEINDEKTIDRLDNAVLDGSDVDVYLRDRVKRRDIFMSMTMNMIWEFVFTRYLFGMDREQRQKLKSLEKLLTEVGPPKRFKRQRDLDTEAVVQAIFQTLCKILPPPTNLEDQIQSQLRRVMREAVGLSIEMRTQKAEYMMLPPLRPEYDADGELTATVQFNASMMNERSGSITTSNEDLEAQGAIVRVVLFPLVVKKGDDNGKGDEEIVVCPAQVLVPRSRMFPGASDGGSTSIGARSHISLVTETMGQTEVDY
ncbi:hypothetical protein FCULG_00003735 [Fusarium culmorum]|uniref:Involucrin repeat protein n=1 Tax=Fusarium culmorum TaxID=5516 RepID=A0A2T4HC69_FUSCU|nr:hypothetical protein FCULG_00003735 [Fusarium culmorum]